MMRAKLLSSNPHLPPTNPPTIQPLRQPAELQSTNRDHHVRLRKLGQKSYLNTHFSQLAILSLSLLPGRFGEPARRPCGDGAAVERRRDSRQRLGSTRFMLHSTFPAADAHSVCVAGMV